MKTTLFVSILLLVGFVSCKKSGNAVTNDRPSFIDTITFAHSMKGWELYSFPAENDWTYSILMGTNRGKTYEEVTSTTVKVIGKESLKLLLAKLPANEYVFWRGNGWLANTSNDHFNLTMPDSNTVDEIKDFCIQRGLVLSVYK